jgi:protein gp37
MTTEKTNRSTGIEWTEHTWNPFVGCTIHTAGCTNCYAMRTAMRLQEFGMPSYMGTVKLANGQPVWTGKINRSSDDQMRKPLKIKKPSLIFVNSMSDFFHPDAADAWRLEALAIISSTHHQYQVLTKRPEEIAPFLERMRGSSLVQRDPFDAQRFPRNMWIGATVEREDFNHRIDTLREVPAAIRFLSVEPLIGRAGKLWLDGIHWVIVGGESGPGARPMKPEWVREVRDQCVAQNVPLFFKQWGKASNNPIFYEDAGKKFTGAEWVKLHDPNGKGGSLLDGREWKDYPAFGGAS